MVKSSFYSKGGVAPEDITTIQDYLDQTEALKDQTAAIYDDFDDRYLGSKASAPSVDNDGNTLVEGALYWNSVDDAMYAWDGSVWVSLADILEAKVAAELAATNAAASETSAAASASAASTSATNASTSETNAVSSASSASISATNAAASETAAGLSEAAAATSETNASTSETNAASSASSASTSATNAASSALAASSSASAAATSASNASTSETNAASSASAASTSATNAATSASNAASSASSASTSASNASTSETNAAASAAAAAASYDNFDDRYLGAKASVPTLDNDGNALLTGAIYWNTSANALNIYDGATWNTYSPSGGAVDSVNSKIGVVVLDPDDLDDTSTTHKFTSAADISKLAGIESGADVTDATNVAAAGALMDSELTSEASVKALNQGLATTDSPTFAGLTVAGSTVSSFGLSLIDDADAATARTTLGLGTIATVAAPAGTVVGTTDTQTLTNKTIDSAAFSGTQTGDFTTTGTVGVGGASASTYGGDLNVVGGALGGESTIVVANTNTNQFARFGVKADEAQIVWDNADSLVLGTSADSLTSGVTSEYLRISNAGDVTIANKLAINGASITTASIRANAPSTTSSDWGMIIRDSGGSTNLLAIRSDGYFITGTGVSSPMNNTTGAAANAYINATNGVLSRSTSSLRYKTDVEDMPYGLNDVLALRPVTFAQKSTGQRFSGLIAEEVDAAGLTEFVDYNDKGEADALHYGNMVALCIAAIKDLKAEIDELKGQING